MARRLTILLLLVCGCKTDPDRWPEQGKVTFAAFCGGMFGAARVCPCFTERASQRIPWRRAQALVAGADGGFGDIMNTIGAIGRECSAELPLAPWPPVARDAFMNGCMQSKSYTQASCECIAEIAQKRMSAEAYLSAGFSMQAGDSMAPPVQDLFKGKEASACLDLAADAPWPPDFREKIVAQCRSDRQIPGELCPCIADEWQRDLTYREFVLLASEKPGSEVVREKMDRLAPIWLGRCSKPSAPTPAKP